MVRGVCMVYYSEGGGGGWDSMGCIGDNGDSKGVGALCRVWGVVKVKGGGYPHRLHVCGHS